VKEWAGLVTVSGGEANDNPVNHNNFLSSFISLASDEENDKSGPRQWVSDAAIPCSTSFSDDLD